MARQKESQSWVEVDTAGSGGSSRSSRSQQCSQLGLPPVEVNWSEKDKWTTGAGKLELEMGKYVVFFIHLLSATADGT